MDRGFEPHSVVVFDRDLRSNNSMSSVISISSLDPRKVRPSRRANRHTSAFDDDAFALLKAEIAHVGGVVQPIMARRIESDTYEIVFGHRRHRACLELDIPALANIVEVSDTDAWCEPELAASIGVDVDQAAKMIRLAELPSEVIQAFPSPRNIRVNWTPKLCAALDTDRLGVRERALRMTQRDPSASAREVFIELVYGLAGGEPINASQFQKTSSRGVE